MTYIPQPLRQLVAERAGFICEYCQTAEMIVGGPFHIEHIRPVKLGGRTVADNLAYACARCNLSKAARTYYTAPGDDRYVPLFSPRRQSWHHHFLWSADGALILGRTHIGRATAAALNLNHPTIVSAPSVDARRYSSHTTQNL